MRPTRLQEWSLLSLMSASIRLRAHAFGNERTLADVAARRLRFDAETDAQDAVP